MANKETKTPTKVNKSNMKTLGYIYGSILRVMEGSITENEAIEMIRAVVNP